MKLKHVFFIAACLLAGIGSIVSGHFEGGYGALIAGAAVGFAYRAGGM